MQLRVFGMGLFHDRDVGVPVFPDRNGVPIGECCHGLITREQVSSGDLNVCQGANGMLIVDKQNSRLCAKYLLFAAVGLMLAVRRYVDRLAGGLFGGDYRDFRLGGGVGGCFKLGGFEVGEQCVEDLHGEFCAPGF